MAAAFASAPEFHCRIRPRPILVPAPEPPPSPTAAPPAEVPASLSPSQIATWGDCQVKWYYKKVLGLPDPANGARALGRAVHQAVEHNFAQKLHTREDLPVEGVVALFRDAFTAELDQGATLDAEESAGELADLGHGVVSLYMDHVAPTIQPAAVELAVAGRIGGIPVTGYIDVLDVEGRVIDLKTAAKKPAGIRPDYRNQVTTYAMLEPRATAARLDTIAKTKTLTITTQTVEVGEADRRFTERLYSIAHEQMRGGVYAPNRASFLCSRKHCPYWERCEDEYGGRVDE